MQYEFIESSLFTKMVYDYLSEDDYTAFQQFLLEQPEAGDVVKGSAKCGGHAPVLASLVVFGCATTHAIPLGKYCCW